MIEFNISEEAIPYLNFRYRKLLQYSNTKEKANEFMKLYLKVALWYAESRDSDKIDVQDLEKARKFAYDLTSPNYPKPK